MTLSRRLMLLVLASLLPAAVVELHNAVSLRAGGRSQLEQRAQDGLRQVEQNQARLVEGVRSILATLRQARVVLEPDDAACQALMGRLRGEYPAHLEVYVTDQDGRIRCATETRALGVGVADRAVVRAARDGASFTMGTAIVSRATGRPVLPFSSATGTDGVRGAVIATVDVGWLAGTLSRGPLEADITILVADRDGTVLARAASGDMGAGGALPGAYASLFTATERGVRLVRTAEGRSLLTAFAPPGPDSLFVAVGIDRDMALGLIDGALAEFGAALSLSLLAAVLGSLWLSRRYVQQPVQRLADIAQRWSTGDLTVRAAVDTVDLAPLVHDLNGMAEALAQQRDDLRNAQSRYRAVFETAVDAMVVIDEAATIVSCNPAAETTFGYTATEMLGRNVSMLMPERERVRHDGYLTSYYRTGVPKIIGIGRGVEGRRCDGSVFPLDLSIAEWRDAGGRRFFTGIMRDTTARRQAEADLEARAARLRLLAELAGDLLGTGDPDKALRQLILSAPPGLGLDVVIVHELAEGLLHLSHAYGLEGQAEDLDRLAIDTPPFGLVAAGEHPVILAASGDPDAAGHAACRALGFRAFAGFPLMAADGTLMAVLSFASFSRDGFAPADLDLLGTVAHDVAAVRDRLRVARILAESEAFAASVIENSPDRIEVLDFDGRLVSVNSHSRRALGLTDADGLAGVDWIGVWPAEARPEMEAAIDEARAGATGRFAATGPGLVGTPVSWDVAVAPIPGPDGKPRLLLATARDVTVRMMQERDLRAREATLSAVLDALPVGVIIADAHGRILRDNAANRAIWGVPPETRDWSGYADWEAYWPGTGKRIQAHEWAMARALLRGEVVQDELVEYQPFSGGPRRLYLNNAAPVRDETGAIVGGVVAELDVTERYATEQALREASERLDLALEAGAILGTWIWDLRADRFTADERFARVFDLDARACHDGVAIADVLPSVHPEDLPGLVRAIDAVVRRGGAYAHQYRVRQQGDGYRWIEANGRVEMDADGVPLRFPGVLLDIAERKRAEEKQRLLAREVDHRAKNALAVVATVVRATRAEDQAAFVEAVEGRISALARAHRLLANAGWTGADLASLVADELDPFTGADRDRARIEGPPVMLAPDAVQPMAMILHELATNAAKYGALSQPTGWLVLSWRRDDRLGLDIRWHEEGGPPLDGPPTRRGFGSEMLAAAAGQLGGPAHFVWDPAGLRCLLTVARENLVLF